MAIGDVFKKIFSKNKQKLLPEGQESQRNFKDEELSKIVYAELYKKYQNDLKEKKAEVDKSKDKKTYNENIMNEKRAEKKVSFINRAIENNISLSDAKREIENSYQGSKKKLDENNIQIPSKEDMYAIISSISNEMYSVLNECMATEELLNEIENEKENAQNRGNNQSSIQNDDNERNSQNNLNGNNIENNRGVVQNAKSIDKVEIKKKSSKELDKNAYQNLMNGYIRESNQYYEDLKYESDFDKRAMIEAHRKILKEKVDLCKNGIKDSTDVNKTVKKLDDEKKKLKSEVIPKKVLVPLTEYISLDSNANYINDNLRLYKENRNEKLLDYTAVASFSKELAAEREKLEKAEVVRVKQAKADIEEQKKLEKAQKEQLKEAKKEQKKKSKDNENTMQDESVVQETKDENNNKINYEDLSTEEWIELLQRQREDERRKVREQNKRDHESLAKRYKDLTGENLDDMSIGEFIDGVSNSANVNEKRKNEFRDDIAVPQSVIDENKRKLAASRNDNNTPENPEKYGDSKDR